LILMGLSVAQAGVFPSGAGILTALDVALQFPAMYALDTVGPLYYAFTVGGSILFGAGLNEGYVRWVAAANFEKGKIKFTFGFPNNGRQITAVFPEAVE
jgi:hypothetical protein